MKKTMLAFSFAALAAFAGEWNGTISDSKCGAAHADGSEKSMKCSQACVKSGKADAVLVTSDGKIYKFANGDKAKEHVGHKVTVSGDLQGETITIANVKMQQ